jgi:predicted transcriptional regulator
VTSPEDMPADEQTAVTVNLSRDTMRALETMTAEHGLPRTWVLNVAIQHLAECRHAEPIWNALRSQP